MAGVRAWAARCRRVLLPAMVALTALSGGAHGQAAPSAPDDPLAALIERSRADPADEALTLALARGAAAAGDLETAIGALERLLLVDPARPRVRFELGLLYFRLGAYAQAKPLIERAVAESPNDAGLANRAQPYLTSIRRATARQRVSGSVLAAVRVQSNPAAAGRADLRQANGTVRGGRGARTDAALVGQARLRHSWRFETQWDDRIDPRSWRAVPTTPARPAWTSPR